MPFIRSIGRWSLTGLVINAIIGASIFGLPSELTRLVGRASPLAVLLAALIISTIVACMAEVASQFAEPGGAYLYVRTAFGRFAGLQVGWFWVLASIGGGAGCANLFVQYLASFWPAAEHGLVRVGIMTALITIPLAANYVGARTGANLSSVLTVGKILPLVLLIVLGLTYFSRQPHAGPVLEIGHAGWSAWLSALLLLTFAYSGFENALAPAGEVKEPRRSAPFALVAGLLICALLYSLIQFVSLVTIGMAPSDHPMAEVAAILLGRGGSLFVSLAVMLSTYGWIAGDILLSPRILYSFAAQGDAPPFLARLHPRFDTPVPALLFYSSLMWILAVTGSFLWVAAVAGASSLVLYSGVCASLIRLRRSRPQADAVRIPFGPVLPVIAIAVSLALISALDLRQALLMGVTALIAGANWWWARRYEARQSNLKIAVAS